VRNPYLEGCKKIKIDFVDFVDENTNIDDDDYNFPSVGNRDRFRQNQAKRMLVSTRTRTSSIRVSMYKIRCVV
jgi:hypothetical protein